MNNTPEPVVPAAGTRRSTRPEHCGPDPVSGVLKALSPGVVDFLFRQLVAGESAEDTQWQREGTVLSAQADMRRSRHDPARIGFLIQDRPGWEQGPGEIQERGEHHRNPAVRH